jgi:hypothetical protein
LGKNITGWQDGPMARFLKPMSASAAVGQVSPSDGVEAIEAARKARDALSSTKLSAALRKERDESAGIKVTLSSNLQCPPITGRFFCAKDCHVPIFVYLFVITTLYVLKYMFTCLLLQLCMF